MRNWPHAPPHRLTEAGAYMVTIGTYGKEHRLSDAARLDYSLDLLFACAEESGWALHAWAVLSNHCHFVAASPQDPASLKTMLSKLHTLSAREFNREDRTPGRKTWFQYFDSHVTFPESYYARMKYVQENPAHHGVVPRAENYPWCSAHWFSRTADAPFRKTVESFKTDRIHVLDSSAPVPIRIEGAASSRRKGKRRQAAALQTKTVSSTQANFFACGPAVSRSDTGTCARTFRGAGCCRS